MIAAFMEKICGFIVVRKSEYSTNELLKPNLIVREKIYQGVDRLRWEDMDVAYYEKRLPLSLLPIWQELNLGAADFSGLKLLKEYQKAKEVACFSGKQSEIIAIWSPELDEMKGSFHCDVELNYLGIDCFALGEWSALLSGVYACPEYFTQTVAQLNQHGLLTSEAECDALFDRYLDLATSEIVEPLGEGTKATNIRVFVAVKEAGREL